MNKIKLSIIIPVYNASTFIDDCLGSIINQSVDFNDLEVVCIDDGSTDKSLSIIRGYAEKYPFIKIYHKENEGIAETRNYGLNVATGEYLMFVDSDDGVAKNSLNQLIDIINNETFDFFRFSYSCIFDDDKINASVNNFDYSTCQTRAEDAPFQVWGVLYKKSLFNQFPVKFNKVFRTREDYIFNYLLFASASASRSLVTDAKIYVYRVRNGSLSHIMSYKSEEFQLERYSDMINYIKECNSYVETQNDSLSDYSINVIKNKIPFFASTALTCAIRCRTMPVKVAQKELIDLGVYPIKVSTRNNSFQGIIKTLLTKPIIINIIDKFSFLKSN